MKISEEVGEFFEEHRPEPIRFSTTELMELASACGAKVVPAGDGLWELIGVCGSTVRFSPETGLVLNWRMDLSRGTTAVFEPDVNGLDLQVIVALVLKGQTLPNVSVPVKSKRGGALVVLRDKKDRSDVQICFQEEISLNRERWRVYGESVPVIVR